MLRKTIVFMFAYLITGCVSNTAVKVEAQKSPPKDTSSICSILGEKPLWNKSLNAVKDKYSVPHHIILAMMYQESRFVHNARPMATASGGLFGTPFASSAYGYSQALELTWAHYMQDTGQQEAKRDEFEDSAMFMGWYITRSNKELKLSKWDAEVQYLAYHEGHGGYKKKTYTKKKWLVDVSKKVKKRADMYWGQYQKCSDDLSEGGSFLEKYII